jgi:hypothetical protein
MESSCHGNIRLGKFLSFLYFQKILVFPKIKKVLETLIFFILIHNTEFKKSHILKYDVLDHRIFFKIYITHIVSMYIMEKN